MFDPGPARLAIVLAPASPAIEGAAASIADAWTANHQGAQIVAAPDPAIWPFSYPLPVVVPDPPAIVWIPAIHEAFVNRQSAGTRLVTTQAPYLVQAWLDAIGDRDILMLATADGDSLAQYAPEVLEERGPFANLFVHDAGAGHTQHRAWTAAKDSQEAILAIAFRAHDPEERLSLCVQALERGRTTPALVATASACVEVNDLEAAARDLDEAIARAPEWAAAHFERGKLWLRADDMARARASFQDAVERMPRLAGAWANLGATLGELDRPEEALAAFEQALACDPNSPQVLNNVGVVNRELGHLAQSEAAFRGVIQRAPDLAFGHYNLGHTLFLQGRYQAALMAYVEGQKRDPERNAVQASRLALCRLAAGDAGGALIDLKRAISGLPQDYRRQLLADTNAIAWALLTHRPDLPGWKQVSDWLSGELAKYT